MSRFTQTLSQINNGDAAWDEFLAGVQNAFENNAASAPVLFAIIGIAVIIWIDVRLAKWIVRGRKQPKSTTKHLR